MPPRLSKRQQRELEDLEALSLTNTKLAQEQSSEDEEEPLQAAVKSGGGFASLLAGDIDGKSEEEDEGPAKSTKSKKKKKKPVEKPASETTSPQQVPPTEATQVDNISKSEKKALKRAKQKEKKAVTDDLDQVLAELNIQYPASQKLSHATNTRQSLADLLGVSLQHLDAEAEMRKFFGSRVVTATKAESSTSRKKPQAVRSHLTRPQATWWAAKGREGLSLRALTDEEVDEKLDSHAWQPLQEKWWTVEYSKRYKSMTKAFMGTVYSGDPQGFWDLLGILPWHADTLLQISEVYRHREEHAQAVDFVDRALFTYERCFMGAFTFTSGLNRLDFNFVENRPFFLALHRQTTDLQRRGCVRTAFEFAKLLYSLDPWEDPHGATLHLDFLAIKSGMSQWLLDMFEVFDVRRSNASTSDARLDPTFLPGWAYAKALALRNLEETSKEKDRTKSTEALRQAAQDFPSVVPLLADKLDVNLTAAIRAHRDFRIETDAQSLSAPNGVLHLLSHLYVQRSLPLWKEHSSWFASTVKDTFQSLPSTLPITGRRKAFMSQYGNTNLRHSVYRHIMVLETSYRRLFSYIPRSVLDVKSLACDPLPPLTLKTMYNDDFFKGIDDPYTARMRSRRGRANDEQRLAQMIPDAAFRQQFQALFDAHPQMAERFPGGILQFAQMVGQLPPDVVEDMLAEVVRAGPGGQGGMPGGFDDMQDDDNHEGMVEVHWVEPGQDGQVQNDERNADIADEEDEDAEEDGDEDDEEDDVSPMPRMIRNVFRRLWGGGAEADGESSEDEEPAPMRDDLGVD
ncbi:transcriptional repressor TCF25-domain-containing protein [Panaeolus papilionaceus]|nr:transcriptional repressor TCF25-domain-containing protein [Panaeolus papilionaceus]